MFLFLVLGFFFRVFDGVLRLFLSFHSFWAISVKRTFLRGLSPRQSGQDGLASKTTWGTDR